MYKSIVFDLGGVMVDFAPRAYLVDRICNEEIEEQVYDLTFGSEEWKQLDAGLCFRPLSPAPELRQRWSGNGIPCSAKQPKHFCGHSEKVLQ